MGTTKLRFGQVESSHRLRIIKIVVLVTTTLRHRLIRIQHRLSMLVPVTLSRVNPSGSQDEVGHLILAQVWDEAALARLLLDEREELSVLTGAIN